MARDELAGRCFMVTKKSFTPEYRAEVVRLVRARGRGPDA